MANVNGNYPHYRCQAYNDQFWDWKLINDVYKGTRWMRLCATTYLPREPAESERAYTIRKNKSILYNALKQTIRGLTGMVFKRDPGESTDIPAKIQDDMDDIDLAGTNFNVFCKDLFKAASRDGHCFVLVDFQESDVAVVSRYDEEASGRRAYWLLYTKNQVINWRTSTVNGKVVLDQVTIEEEIYVPTGSFGEVKKKQWRVLRPGYWEIYETNPQINTNSVNSMAPTPTRAGSTSLDYIPLIPVYCNKTGYFTSEPPLLDLAYLNIRHFQIYSDYGHILHVANVPILWFIGRQKSNQQEVGPNAGIDLDEGGAMGWAEHGGSAIGGARTEILDLEERMNLFGLLMLSPKDATATEKVINKSHQMSVLSEMASSFKDGVESCLMVHGDYYGLPDGGQTNIIKDFDKLVLDPVLLQIYIQMVKETHLSIETLWEMMSASDLLPDTFDPKVERERVIRDIKDGLVFVQRRESLNLAPSNTSGGGGANNEPNPMRPRTGPESFGQTGVS